MRKKIILYYAISIIALVVLFSCFAYLKKDKASKDSGSFYVYLIDLEGIVVDKKEIMYQKGDTLVDVLKVEFDNFNMNNNGFLHSIGSLEEEKTQEKWIYISIILDDEYSNKGLSQISLKDGMVIKFILEEYLYA